MSDNDKRPNDGLDDNWIDKAVAATTGAAGLVPIFGGPFAEVIGVAIPGQRADQIDTDMRDELASNAEKIDLIEEGGYQAAARLRASVSNASWRLYSGACSRLRTKAMRSLCIV